MIRNLHKCKIRNFGGNVMLEMSEYKEKLVSWEGELQEDAFDLLDSEGKFVVVPTKVGYIIATSDKAGLERKFDAKKRKRNKPGVVLTSSMDQLRELAQLTPNIEKLYQKCFDNDILLGCILPWKEEAIEKYVPEGAEELMMDDRQTSCFVIHFGVPGEQLSAELWENGNQLMFASSANPSGQGNRGLIEGIGERIADEADLIVEGNDYVASIQPEETVETRYEQGVMVSFVDDEGNIMEDQDPTSRSADKDQTPVLIRKGLYINEIMAYLSDDWNSWDYRHGQYY